MNVKKHLVAVAYVAYIAGALASVVSHVGPARWLADLQLAWFGSYWSTATLLVLLLPAALVFRLFGGSASDLDVERSLPKEWAQDLFVPSIILAVGLAVATIPLDHGLAPDLGAISAADAESWSRSSFYASVNGFVDRKEVIGVKKGSATAMLYAPLRRAPGDLGPARLIVEVQENEVDQKITPGSGTPGSADVHGFVDRRTDAFAIASLEKRGIQVASDVRVIHTRVARRRALITATVLPLLVLGIAAFRLRSNRKARLGAERLHTTDRPRLMRPTRAKRET